MPKHTNDLLYKMKGATPEEEENIVFFHYINIT